MRWDHVIPAVTKAAVEDPTLSSIFGSSIRKTSDMPEWKVPLLSYMMTSDTASELWEPVVVQWTILSGSLSQIALAERALRDLFDHDFPRFIEGVYMWTTFIEGGDLQGPAREGFYGRVVSFRYTPVRESLTKGR